MKQRRVVAWFRFLRPSRVLVRFQSQDCEQHIFVMPTDWTEHTWFLKTILPVAPAFGRSKENQRLCRWHNFFFAATRRAGLLSREKTQGGNRSQARTNHWVQTICGSRTDMGTEPCDVTNQTLLRRARSQEHFSADGRQVHCARFVDAKLKGLTFG